MHWPCSHVYSDEQSGMTFYSPDLTPFVRALVGGGVPTRNAVYNHPLNVDGAWPRHENIPLARKSTFASEGV